ncbi:MAG: bifunctional phosphoribosyl-AMP cyclohydrolase/phosphoribosyl-ATP diphosphatase HisIE [Rudaea sp.]
MLDPEGNALPVDDLAWDKQNGLLPTIVQDAATLRVLMLGYVNRNALRATLSSRKATFFSRSRGKLWMKGESSGNALDVVQVAADCDRDALLVLAQPLGPTCHHGTPSCFSPYVPSNMIGELDAVVAQRASEHTVGSYTQKLFESGIVRIAQKVGEEGVETALAAVTASDEELLGEAADLVYHLIVLLRARGLSIRDVDTTLRERHGK